ncbi:uncharacterized protein LOC116293931 [Actinia tenebrosa]|uniref:Uncharacterized protein LOC116293931 n=1 Tax=Actinia tenebrosa TaxID=6105 RepID=A0A6P8HXI3_ACTTE|nr:uncharacterized protein LOC116293931 [Actinia tenebrosa]
MSVGAHSETRSASTQLPSRARIVRVISPLHLLIPAGCHDEPDVVNTTNHADQRPHLLRPVLRKLLLMLDGIQLLSALEVKVKCGAMRVVFVKSDREKHLLRCSVVCDITRGKVHVKLRTPLVVPKTTSLAMLRNALETVNRILNQLVPLGNSVLTSLLSANILKAIIFGKDNVDDQLSDRPNAEESQKINALMASLLCLDITLRLTKDIKVILKRKERFRISKKTNVELEARNGMQSFKEPRNRFQQKKVSNSIAKLYEWIRKTRGRSVTCQVLELVSHLDYYCENEIVASTN